MIDLYNTFKKTTGIKISIYESFDNNLITENEMKSLLSSVKAREDFILESYTENFIQEAEEYNDKQNEYEYQKTGKKLASFYTGKDLDKMPNKKFAKDKDGNYKNPEKAEKERVKNWIKSEWGSNSPNSRDKNIDYRRNDAERTSEHIAMNKISKSDFEMFKQLKKRANYGNEADKKKYKQVFKMLCTKYNIDPDSQIWASHLDPDGDFSGDIHVYKEIKKTIKNKMHDKGYPTPPGYHLLHKTSKDGLTELKPNAHSELYTGSGGDIDINGQFYPTKRIYLVLKRDSDDSMDNFGKGEHVYKVISPVKEFFIDPENSNSRHMDKMKNISKLIASAGDSGLAVYVKTDKPLKVKQLR